MSFSNKKYKILQGISLKVYEAERVAIIADGEDSGRHSLLQLLLLNQTPDDYSEDSIDFKRPFIEFMGKDSGLVEKKELRKDMIFLSQYPCLFYGTVRENIDPYNEFEEEDIITTLHFLKVSLTLTRPSASFVSNRSLDTKEPMKSLSPLNKRRGFWSSGRSMWTRFWRWTRRKPLKLESKGWPPSNHGPNLLARTI